MNTLILALRIALECSADAGTDFDCQAQWAEDYNAAAEYCVEEIELTSYVTVDECIASEVSQ